MRRYARLVALGIMAGDTHFAAPGGPPVSDTVRIALIAIVAVAAARLIVPRVPVVGPQLAAFV